jgi:hypothetical protein
MNLEALLNEAPIVVYGKVVQIEVESGTGFRTALVEPLDVARAPAEFKDAREFYIPLRDRAIPRSDIIERVSQAPDFKLDEEVLLFLHPIPVRVEGLRHRKDGRRIFAMDGFFQGKFKIFEDKEGVRRVLAWDEGRETRTSDQDLRAQSTTARRPLHAQSQRETLDRPQARALDAVLNSARSIPVNATQDGEQ